MIATMKKNAESILTWNGGFGYGENPYFSKLKEVGEYLFQTEALVGDAKFVDYSTMWDDSESEVWIAPLMGAYLVEEVRRAEDCEYVVLYLVSREDMTRFMTKANQFCSGLGY